MIQLTQLSTSTLTTKLQTLSSIKPTKTPIDSISIQFSGLWEDILKKAEELEKEPSERDERGLSKSGQKYIEEYEKELTTIRKEEEKKIVRGLFQKNGISKEDLLIFAAEKGNLQEVIKALESGVDVNARSVYAGGIYKLASAPEFDWLAPHRGNPWARYAMRDTALMRATAHGHLDIVKELLKRGADVNVIATAQNLTFNHEANDNVKKGKLNADSALFRAIRYGHNKIVDVLLKAGADYLSSYSYSDKTTPIILAVKCQKTDSAKLLIDAGVKVKANKSGESLVELAVNNKDIKTLKLLLKEGASISKKALEASDESTFPILLAGKPSEKIIKKVFNQALSLGDLTKAKALKGTSLSKRELNRLLSGAVKNQSLDRVSNIIKEGANPKIKGLLITAISRYNVDNAAFVQLLVDLLILAGADVNTKDSEGQSLLIRTLRKYGSSNSVQGMLKALLAENVNLLDEDDHGDIALTYAATYFNIPAMETLIKADPKMINHLNKAGDTLLLKLLKAVGKHYYKFSMKKLVNTTQELIKAGVDVKAKNKQGHSALSVALDKGYIDVARIIEAHSTS